jgi:hypothetical protein
MAEWARGLTSNHAGPRGAPALVEGVRVPAGQSDRKPGVRACPDPHRTQVDTQALGRVVQFLAVPERGDEPAGLSAGQRGGVGHARTLRTAARHGCAPDNSPPSGVRLLTRAVKAALNRPRYLHWLSRQR